MGIAGANNASTGVRALAPCIRTRGQDKARGHLQVRARTERAAVAGAAALRAARQVSVEKLIDDNLKLPD